MQNSAGGNEATDEGDSSDADSLARSFSAFARSAQRQHDPYDTLVEIVRAAVELVPGCDEASVSLVVGRRRVVSEAASGPLPEALDDLQGRLGQGPCLDAAYEQHTVRVPDMATDHRWPLFCPAAVSLGAAAMLCFQLYLEDDDLGALNLFSRTVGAFDDESEHVGSLFAAHAATAYSASSKHARLMSLIGTRDLIGQAQGILMERYKVTSAQAFALLVRVSQEHNTPLREVATQLTISGEMHTPPT